MKDCFGNAKKAIDIGTGSGYVALSLAKMMKGDDFKVYALDHIPKLVDEARENISKYFFIRCCINSKLEATNIMLTKER